MTRTGAGRLLAILVTALGALLCLAVPAQAAEQVRTYVVNAPANAAGSLEVESSTTFPHADPAPPPR